VGALRMISHPPVAPPAQVHKVPVVVASPTTSGLDVVSLQTVLTSAQDAAAESLFGSGLARVSMRFGHAHCAHRPFYTLPIFTDSRCPEGAYTRICCCRPMAMPGVKSMNVYPSYLTASIFLPSMVSTSSF